MTTATASQTLSMERRPFLKAAGALVGSTGVREYGGDDFWMSARRQQTDEDELWELRMAREAAQAVAATGMSFPDEDYRPGSFFDKLAPVNL